MNVPDISKLDILYDYLESVEDKVNENKLVGCL